MLTGKLHGRLLLSTAQANRASTFTILQQCIRALSLLHVSTFIMSRQNSAKLFESHALNASFCRLPLQGDLQGRDVLHLEQRSFNAWPAPQTLLKGDWALRLAGGYTKRANSVNAMQAGVLLDVMLLGEIEQVYTRQGQPCIFRISPLADIGVDALLQTRGYQMQSPSLFMSRAGQAGDADGPPIVVDDAVRPAWLDGICRANRLSLQDQDFHRAILRSIGLRCGYASIVESGRAVAWGLAVLERSAVGLYDVVVEPEMRGQGLGRALIKGLLRWAAEHDAQSVDLQVAGDNHVAQSLYCSLGFEPVYGYHYRTQEGHS